MVKHAAPADRTSCNLSSNVLLLARLIDNSECLPHEHSMQESLCLHRRNPDVFAAQKLRRNAWVPVKLRITAFAIERLDASTG